MRIINEIQIVRHLAQSGNRADVILPDYQPIGCCGEVEMAWENSPSQEDLWEFHEEVWPKRIVPVVIHRLEQRTGKPYRSITIAPGFCAFIPNESVQ